MSNSQELAAVKKIMADDPKWKKISHERMEPCYEARLGNFTFLFGEVKYQMNLHISRGSAPGIDDIYSIVRASYQDDEIARTLAKLKTKILENLERQKRASVLEEFLTPEPPAYQPESDGTPHRITAEDIRDQGRID